jgi:hypothetical protein
MCRRLRAVHQMVWNRVEKRLRQMRWWSLLDFRVDRLPFSLLSDFEVEVRSNTRQLVFHSNKQKPSLPLRYSSCSDHRPFSLRVSPRRQRNTRRQDFRSVRR